MIRIHFNAFVGAHVENSLLDKQCTILTKTITETDHQEGEVGIVQNNAVDFNGHAIVPRDYQSKFLNDYDIKPRLVKEDEISSFTDYLLPLLKNQIIQENPISETFDYDEILDVVHKLVEKLDYFNGFHFNHVRSDFNYNTLLLKFLDEEYSNSSVNVFTNNDVFQQLNILKDYKTSLIVMHNQQINKTRSFTDYSNFSATALYSLPLSSTMSNASPRDIVQSMNGLSNIVFKTKLDVINEDMAYSGVDSKQVHSSMPLDKNNTIPVTFAFPYWFSSFKVVNSCLLSKDSGLGFFAQAQLKHIKDLDLKELAYDTIDYYQIATEE